MRTSSLILASAALWLCSATVTPAQDKVDIGIAFALKAKHFTDELTDEQIGKLNDMASAGIERALNAGVGFLNFEAGSADPHQLSIELDRSDRSDSLGESGFDLFVTLNGPGFAEPLESKLIFQTIANFATRFPTLEAFSRQIEQTFDEANQRQLVSDLLSQVAIADHADFQRETSSWIVHRDRVVLCMGHKSQLIVVGKVPNELGSLREMVATGIVVNVDNPDDWIFARAKDDPEDPVIALLQAADPARLETKKVAVVAYTKCELPKTVSQAALPAGGGEQ